jgi:23S rRNA (adenine2503-C2)-methyltransferase
MPTAVDLQELNLAELEELMAAWGQPRFRARQILKWVYKGVQDFEGMTDLAGPFGRSWPPGPGWAV